MYSFLKAFLVLMKLLSLSTDWVSCHKEIVKLKLLYIFRIQAKHLSVFKTSVPEAFITKYEVIIYKQMENHLWNWNLRNLQMPQILANLLCSNMQGTKSHMER